MALINCPECNKEISDKSGKCLHCGYPLRNTPYIFEEICGQKIDVSFLLDKSVSQAKQIKRIVEITGCDLLEAKKIVLKYHPSEEINNTNKRKCPNCGHTAFTPVRKKWSFWTGFATNKTELICNNCGKRVE